MLCCVLELLCLLTLDGFMNQHEQKTAEVKMKIKFVELKIERGPRYG